MKKNSFCYRFFSSHIFIFFFCCIVFSICVNFNFFIKKQFFSEMGSTNLLLFFSIIPYLCILIVPALCYRTNICIYDDFIPQKRIIKILNNFLYIFLLFSIILLLIFPSVIIVNLCGSVDFASTFTSYFSLLLYGSSIISLCIFINQLFSSNVLSFIISSLCLAIFNSIHLIPLYVSLPSFITNLCKKLSFAWHFNSASKGIIDTRDIIWFISLSFIFLFSTYLLDEKKRGKKFIEKKAFNKFSIFAVYIILFLFIFNSEKYYKQIDFSKGKSYSLSDYSKSILHKVDESIKVTYYRSPELEKLYPQIRDIQDYLITYFSSNKNISLIIKDPHKNDTTKLLESYGIPSQQIKTINKNSTEYLNVYSAIVLESGNKIQTIPFILDMEFLEYSLCCKLKSIISNDLREVNIVVGNGMSLSSDYNYLIPFLNAQNFLCNPLYVEDPNFSRNLELCNGPLFVIGDNEINIENAIAIENYILSGKGNAFFNISPFSSKIEDDWSLSLNKMTNIVEMLENWGVTFTNNICADISCSRIMMYSQEESQNEYITPSTYTKIINYPFWINIMPQQNSTKGCTIFWPTELILSKNCTPYFLTSKFGHHYEVDFSSSEKILETNPFYVDVNNDKEKYEHIIAAEINGELTGLYNVASIEHSKIIVIPDQYFVNSLMTGYIGGEYGDYRNFDTVTSILLELNNESELAKLYNKNKIDTSLYKITTEEDANKIQNITYVFCFIIYPLFLILVCIFIIFIRNQKIKKYIKENLYYEK